MSALSVVHTEASRGLGGQEKRILLEAASFIERGHEALIVGQPDGKLRKEAEEEGVPFEPLRMRASWDALALGGLVRLIRKRRPDLIHTHSSKDSWLGGIAGRMLGVPVVRTRHVSIPVSPHGLNWVYRLPRRVMTTADLTRNLLIDSKACAPGRVKALPTGVDFRRFHEGVSGEGFRREAGLEAGTPAVGIMAQLRGSKGHEEFLAAARILKDEGCAAKFFVGGGGEGRATYEAEAARLGLLDDAVVFIGYRTDVPEVMAGLDVLVIASTRTEGVPQVALQGMAMGLPIVGTDVGGVPEALRPSGAGVVVPSRDPAALADGIRRLLRDPAAREEMGRAGREYARRWFSLDKMVDDTLTLYEEALSTCGS